MFQGFNTDDPAKAISLLAGFLITFLGVHLLEISRKPALESSHSHPGGGALESGLMNPRLSITGRMSIDGWNGAGNTPIGGSVSSSSLPGGQGHFRRSSGSQSQNRRGQTIFNALEEDDAMRQWVEDMRAGMVRIDGDHAHLSSQQQHQHNQQQQRRSTAQQQQHAALRTKAACASVTMWSTLHLARQTRLVAACKEAIWEAYQALAAAAADEPSGALRGEPGGALHGEPLRDEFERDWQAWEK